VNINGPDFAELQEKNDKNEMYWHSPIIIGFYDVLGSDIW